MIWDNYVRLYVLGICSLGVYLYLWVQIPTVMLMIWDYCLHS